MHRRMAGMMITDAVLALALVGILMTLLVVATSTQRRGAEALAEQRALARLAERAAHQLQRGEAMPEPQRPNVRLTLTAIDAEPIGDSAWGRVSVTQNAREVSLITLVPTQALQSRRDEAGEVAR